MVLAEQQRERLHTQGLTAYSPHGLGEQGKADVELAGKHAGGNLGAEELGRDDRHVRAVVLDGGQDRAEGLVTSHRGVAEPYRSGDARTSEAGALSCVLERAERQRRL